MLRNHTQWIQFLGIVLVNAVAICSSAPVSNTLKAQQYLSKFGYLSPDYQIFSVASMMDKITWENAIKEFQSFAGLTVTGKLDNETIELMSSPRCGVKDNFGFKARLKRYVLYGGRWSVKDLTYRISKYSKWLEPTIVDEQISNAFNLWSNYTDLTFTPKSAGTVHIEIRFEERDHGDGVPFDGSGGILAHAFFPMYGGHGHFDDAEQWTINTPQGTNLFQVAVHEIGHSLGLSHSKVHSSVMAPFYKGFQSNLQLDADDIKGIQALYGPKTLNRCKSPKIDTIFKDGAGIYYFFRGDKYYKPMMDGIAEGYPKKISLGWPELPSDIDAAVTRENGKTYFFKGTKFWRYHNRQLESGYPREISDGFPGIPDHIDAALLWNSDTYFFKGNSYWRYNSQMIPPVHHDYPKPISDWEGLPNNLDAALGFSDEFFFFYKGSQYYRFNTHTLAVDEDFPKSMTKWYGCENIPGIVQLLNVCIYKYYVM